MKIHRFICPYSINGDDMVIADREVVHQIARVLQLAPGERIIVGIGQGEEILVELEQVESNMVRGHVLQKEENANEPKIKATLYCAVLKKENFELVVQKAAEIGVTAIVPIITERTVKLNLNLDRLKKIVREAAEQSGRGIVPAVKDLISLEQAIVEAKANDVNLFFDPSGEEFERPKNCQNVGVFIGPEGGWTEKEITLAEASKFKIFNLGKLVLRGETAAIIGSFLALF